MSVAKSEIRTMAGLALIGAVAAVALLLATTLLINGVMLYWMWTWFVEPLGAPGITILHAAGLSVLAAMLKSPAKSDDDETVGKAVTKVLARLLVSGALLAIGWVIHWAMLAS